MRLGVAGRFREFLVMLLAGAALVIAPLASGTAQADEFANGRRIVEHWCSQCHAQTGAETNPDRAPTFEQIASRDGRDLRYLRGFLNIDHFPMTTYRLFDHEKDDVAAFIHSLRRR